MTRRKLLAETAVAAGTAGAAAGSARAAAQKPARSAARKPSALLSRLLKDAQSTWLVDTHEHIGPEAARLEAKTDLFYWFSHYASSDLVSAGMPFEALQRARDPNRSLAERWAEMEPFWPHVRTTAYGRALLIAARDLHGVEDISAATYETLSERIAAANKPGLYDRVLRQKGRIAVSVADVWGMGVDDRYFVPAIRFDHFIRPQNREAAARQGGDAASLKGYLDALDSAMAEAKTGGMRAVKSGMAYERTLQVERTEESEAARLFDAAMLSSNGWSWPKPLQDFVVHRIARNAGELGVPFQIHTGLQEGNGNLITNSNPTGLVSLFFACPNTRFDLFHGAYPYCSELATLAKNFSNVYLDMCWLHVISPKVSRRMLSEWLETVPSNKILGFGGDYLFVEGAYAHAVMARENVARTLAEKVEEGYFTEDEAREVQRKLLQGNAAALFGVQERVEAAGA